MLSREDFIFTIGYEANTAIVDGRAKAKYGKLGTAALAEAGMFRAAFSSALYSGKKEELEAFAAIFNAKSGMSLHSEEQFKRLFGVNLENAKKTLVV